MAQTSTTSQSGGIGCCGLLTIVFIALKLTHFIDWSWLWVLAPLWMPITVILAIPVITFLVVLIGAYVIDWASAAYKKITG